MMHTSDEADTTNGQTTGTGTTTDSKDAGADDGSAVIDASNEEEVDARMFTDIFSSSRPKDALDGTWKGAGNVLKGIYSYTRTYINLCICTIIPYGESRIHIHTNPKGLGLLPFIYLITLLMYLCLMCACIHTYILALTSF